MRNSHSHSGSEDDDDPDTEGATADGVLAPRHDADASRSEQRAQMRRAEPGESISTRRNVEVSFLPLIAVLLILGSLYVVFGAIRLLRTVWADVEWGGSALPSFTSDASIAEESVIRT